MTNKFASWITLVLSAAGSALIAHAMHGYEEGWVGILPLGVSIFFAASVKNR